MSASDNPQNERREEETNTSSEPMSLEQLSGAFAGMFGLGESTETPIDEPEESEGAEESAPRLENEADDDPTEVTPRSILEAILFVGRPDNEPLTSRQVAALMRGVEPEEIDELVDELNEEYTANNCPYEIIHVASGYRLVLRERFSGVREKLYGRTRQAKLSQAAIEVLAIVAYNQPITAEEVNKLRGTPSGSLLSQLVRRQLLRIERPDEKPRIAQYHTTERFLQLFGLKDLDDLPRSQDLDKQ